MHSSLRAVGTMEGGAAGLIAAFQKTLGPEGTIVAPTFTFGHSDPAGWHTPPEPESLDAARAAIPLFDPESTPTYVPWMGIFPEVLRLTPGAKRSNHPIVSFAALGTQAEYLTRGAPYHFPLGTDSPLARLHQIGGLIALIGVGHRVNSTLHLAEVWANVPYIDRSVRLKTGIDQWTKMRGSPECSRGFDRMGILFDSSRLVTHGKLGDAPVQIMSVRAIVSLTMNVLAQRPGALLCDIDGCAHCKTARRLISPSLL